ncbi:MAG: C25 family cysteine peptidase, partial [Anaerolineae bacterium]
GPQDNNNDGTADYLATQRTYGDDWGEAIKSMLGAAGIGAYTLYEKTGVYSDGSAYPITAASGGLSTANLVNEWKNGYGLVTWWGHGSYLGAYRRVWANDNTRVDHLIQYPQEATSPIFFYSGDTFQLNNERPSFVVQVSCQNGQPEYLDNLGYRLLVNGAVGTVSSSRLSWYVMGAWAPQDGDGWADNASMGYRILRRMGVYDESLGQGLAHHRAYSALYGIGGFWMNLVGANLYGDPSLSLESAGEPCEVAPGTPASPDPADGTPAVSVEADLAWTADATCLTEPVTYETYLGTNGTASALVCSGSAAACDPGPLYGGTTYTWQVVATSAFGSSASPQWTFGTEEVPTSVPPGIPADPTPGDGASGVALDSDLSWCGGYTCPGEFATYDVYLKKAGEASSTQVCWDLDAAVCEPGLLDEGADYEWQVVSEGLNGPRIGPWWSFSTVSCALLETVTLAYPSEAEAFAYRDAPVLAWDAVPGATGYQVQVFADAALTQVELDTTTTFTVYEFGPSLAGTYYWRVRALATALSCDSSGAWTPARSLEIEPPADSETPVMTYRVYMPITFRP